MPAWPGDEHAHILDIHHIWRRRQPQDASAGTLRRLPQALLRYQPERGERAPEQRTAQRNGYRGRDWDTRVGTVELAVPKLRTAHTQPAGLCAHHAQPILASLVRTIFVQERPKTPGRSWSGSWPNSARPSWTRPPSCRRRVDLHRLPLRHLAQDPPTHRRRGHLPQPGRGHPPGPPLIDTALSTHRSLAPAWCEVDSPARDIYQ
jgi:hypothetical protein